MLQCYNFGKFSTFNSQLSTFNFQLTPVVASGLLYPAIAHPARDDHAQGRLVAESLFQGSQVFDGECRRQAVEHVMVGSATLTLVLRTYILISESFSERLDLLVETVVSHHQCKVKTSLRFLLLATEQMEYDTASEPDYRCTFPVNVLHVVDVLCCLHSLLLHPLFYRLSQARSVNQSGDGTQAGYSLPDSCFVLSRTVAELRHLRERGIGHFGNEDSRTETIFYIVRFETLPHGSVCAEHCPVVGNIHHSRLRSI